jgi:hypothetical protein
MFSSRRACNILLLNYKYQSVNTVIGNNHYYNYMKLIYKVRAQNSDHLNVVYMVTIVCLTWLELKVKLTP